MSPRRCGQTGIILTCSVKDFIVGATANQVPTFATTDTKLYFPFVALST